MSKPTSIPEQKPINKWPAWLDMLEGASGLALTLFMWGHMFLVSSILISKDAMYQVARMFEGEPLFGKPYPILVSLVALAIFTLVIIHAALAMRKFPASYRQHKTLLQHLSSFKHGDTLLWYGQVITGFLLLFLIPIHLYQIMFNPADIGPYASSDRVYSGRMWPLYLALLFLVELHGALGVYRLVIKWGLFQGGDAKRSRKRLQMIKWLITAFFLILGLLTLLAYYRIGEAHANNVGERYHPEVVAPATRQESP